MKSLVLEKKDEITLRDFPAIDRTEEILGARDVRIKMHTVGICGSDVPLLYPRADRSVCCQRTDDPGSRGVGHGD